MCLFKSDTKLSAAQGHPILEVVTKLPAMMFAIIVPRDILDILEHKNQSQLYLAIRSPFPLPSLPLFSASCQ